MKNPILGPLFTAPQEKERGELSPKLDLPPKGRLWDLLTLFLTNLLDLLDGFFTRLREEYELCKLELLKPCQFVVLDPPPIYHCTVRKHLPYYARMWPRQKLFITNLPYSFT